MTPPPFICLSIDRAKEYVGDAGAVLSLLDTLEQSLQSDLPRIQERLDAGDLQGANGAVSYTHLTLPTTSRV